MTKSQAVNRIKSADLYVKKETIFEKNLKKQDIIVIKNDTSETVNRRKQDNEKKKKKIGKDLDITIKATTKVQGS